MYLITVLNKWGQDVQWFTESLPPDFNQERDILKDHPRGYYIDVQRVPRNPFSDSNCWRDYEEAEV